MSRALMSTAPVWAMRSRAARISCARLRCASLRSTKITSVGSRAAGAAGGSAAEQLLQRGELLLGRRPLRTAAAEAEPGAAAGRASRLDTLCARGVLRRALRGVAAAGAAALLLRVLARPTAAEA